MAHALHYAYAVMIKYIFFASYSDLKIYIPTPNLSI